MVRRDGGLVGAGLPLFWRVCLINGSVFVVGTAALAVSPATVSSPVLITEAVVLAFGLAVILVANAVLLRASLAPLDRLTRLMERLDLLRPGQRLPETGNGAVAPLVHSFNAMIDRLEGERGVSAAQALAAQEAERQRIAQELHDEVGQSLTVVLLSLRQLADQVPESLRAEVVTTQDTVRECLDEVRQVARRLRPGVLDDLGLRSALASLATEFDARTGVAVDRRIDGHLPALSREAELVLYRIAQEALTNVARHAHATQVRLSLRCTSGTATLEVADDGCGLGGSAEGAGLRGMRERALLIGAELGVQSGERGGTVVRLAVPTGAR